VRAPCCGFFGGGGEKKGRGKREVDAINVSAPESGWKKNCRGVRAESKGRGEKGTRFHRTSRGTRKKRKRPAPLMSSTTLVVKKEGGGGYRAIGRVTSHQIKSKKREGGEGGRKRGTRRASCQRTVGRRKKKKKKKGRGAMLMFRDHTAEWGKGKRGERKCAVPPAIAHKSRGKKKKRGGGEKKGFMRPSLGRAPEPE